MLSPKQRDLAQRKAWLLANLEKGGRDRRKLTAEQVHEIRFGNERYADLARRFGVSYSVVQQCGMGQTYIDHPLNPDQPAGRRAARLSEGQVIEARRRYAAGESASKIAKGYGVSRRHMSQIISGMSYKWVRG